MAAKKKSPARKTKVTKRVAPKKAKRPKPTSKRTTAKKSATRPRAGPKQGLASRMAAFSQQVVHEEGEPVAVRSFIEARQGIEKSRELDVKTGSTSSIDAEEPEMEFEEEEEETPLPKPTTPPRLEPLTGPLAVPKRKQDAGFTLATPAKKGKKPAAPTKDDLGRIELRMQRGTTDATIARASPDYLQRSFNRAVETGKVSASGHGKKEEPADEERFEVAMDKRKARRDATLTDFGDVEIAQQTRSGRKKLGKLDADEETDG